MANLAQRIGQEFKTLRDNELSLKLSSADFNTMFELSGSDIIFKGNLIPESTETLSIGSETNKIMDLYVSANTIHLGESTTLEGTSIVIDGGANPTSLSETPTLLASALIAKPFTYNPGSGNVTVRPTIAFQDTAGNSYPLSFDTVNNKFSFDALGNHGEGSIVAKDLELSGALTVDGAIVSNSDVRFDSDVILGYDINNTITLNGNVVVKEAMTFEGSPVIFEDGATLGDGNDDIVVNSGLANTFTVTAQNISVDADGNVSAASVNGIESTGTAGEMLYHNGTSWTKISAGTTGQVLEMGADGVPAWADRTIG